MHKKRLINVDFLKGLAMIVMIEVHIFNETVFQSIKSSAIFINFINGLVAPTFIFTSGFAFYISSLRRLPELHFFNKEFNNQLKRMLFLIVAGYSLHLPFYSLEDVIYRSSYDNLISFFKFDVLQCIGLGLIVLLFLRTLLKNNFSNIIAVSILFISFILLTPIVWKIDFNQFFHLSIATIFNNKYKALFPIFPWFAFIFSGYILGYLYTKYKDEQLDNFLKITLYVGLILVFIPHALYLYDKVSFDTGLKSSPLFTLLRLGYLLTLFRLSYYLTERVDLSNSFFINVSRESLFVYWFHLQIMYRKFFNGKSLIDYFPNSLCLTQTMLLSLVLILIMIVLAYYWNKLKNQYNDVAEYIKYSFLLTLLFSFIIL